MLKISTEELTQRLEDSTVALLAGHDPTTMEINIVLLRVFIAASQVYNTHALSLTHRSTLCAAIQQRLRGEK